MKRFEAAWRSYRAAVLPHGVSAVQKIECRRAFYAGAWAFHTETDKLMGPEESPTESEVMALGAMVAELEAFARDVKAGVS